MFALLLTAAMAPSAGWELGVRTGIGLPLGGDTRTASVDLRDEWSERQRLQVPIWLDWSYAIHRWSVGAYASLGYVVPKGRAEMAILDGRFGFQVRRDSIGREAITWIALGAGWESHLMDNGGDSLRYSNRRGIEIASVQIGTDFTTGPRFGPFMAATLGKYLSIDHVDITSERQSITASSGWHYWIFLGGRVLFSI